MSAFECHLTLDLPDVYKQYPPARFSESARALKQAWADLGRERGWKHSEIAGDPVLGPSTYFYLTKYAGDFDSLHAQMREMATAIESATGVKPVREKIEMIVYDTKTGVDMRGRL